MKVYTTLDFCGKINYNTNDMTSTPQQKKIIRVSVSEAARLFGVDSHTIRRAIKSQEITYVVVQGRYKINFESLIKWSQRKIRIKNKTNKDGIGQYIDNWKINNRLYSPNPDAINLKKEKSTNTNSEYNLSK